MFLTKVISKARGLLSPSAIERKLIYLLIAVVPFMIYPIMVNGATIDRRTIREVSFFSIAVVITAFLQKNRWMRYLAIWCVINWWLNYFCTFDNYMGLVNIFSAMAIFIGIKKLIDDKILKSNILLKIIALSVVFEFLWLLMEKFFNYDPVFYKLVNINQGIVAGWSGNPSLCAVFIAVFSFILLYYIPILFFIVLLSVFILKSATAALCLTAGGVFYILNTSKKKYLKTIVVIIIILSLMCLFFILIKHPNIDRIPIWEKIIQKSIHQRPIVGMGLGYFSHLFIKDKAGQVWLEAHNDYLQLFMELGLIGFILFIGFIVSVFVWFYKNERTRKRICVMSSLVAFLTSGLALFPMHLASMSLIAIVLLVCLQENNVNT